MMLLLLLLLRLTLNRSLKLDSLNHHQLLQFTVFLLLVLPGALA